jgi:hypothetical protein
MRFGTSMAVVASAALTLASCIPANASSSAGHTCQAARLSYALGSKSGSRGQITQVVNLTNKGPSACTLRGFPGVDLIGAAHGEKNYSWPLERQSARYSTVTLAPGKTAQTSLCTTS